MRRVKLSRGISITFIDGTLRSSPNSVTTISDTNNALESFSQVISLELRNYDTLLVTKLLYILLIFSHNTSVLVFFLVSLIFL